MTDRNTNGGYYVTGAEIYGAVRALEHKIDALQEELLDIRKALADEISKLKIRYYGVLAALVTILVAAEALWLKGGW